LGATGPIPLGEPNPDPELAPLPVPASDPRLKSVSDETLAEFPGEWPYPPAPLGIPPFTTVSITGEDGALVAYSDVSGTFREYLQPDGSFIEEDSLERYIPILDGDGSFAGIADSDAKAISSFEKSLDLNPGNTDAQEMIARIQEGGETQD